MENKPLSMPVIIAVIVVAVVLVGMIGYHFMNGARTGPNGVDLSQAGQQPASAQGVDQKK